MKKRYTKEEQIIKQKKWSKDYYNRNKEKYILRAKKWMKEHPEKIKDYKRKYRLNRPKKEPKPKTIIICKECGAEKQINPNQLNKNGNFCSVFCCQKWRKEHRTTTDEAIRLNHNRLSKEAYHRKKLKDVGFQNRKELREEKRREKDIRYVNNILLIEQLAEERLRHCIFCNKEFIKRNDSVGKFCSNKCFLNYCHSLPKKPKKKYGSSKGISKKAFDLMRKEYNYTCPKCGQKEPFLDQYWPFLTQDHWIPRSKGGRKRAKDNIVPLCWNCNINKSNTILDRSILKKI